MDKIQSVIWMIDGLGPGGAEQLAPNILRSISESGINIRVCALQVKHGNPIADELTRIGLPVDLVPIPHLRHPLNLFRILDYLRKHRPQVLHTQLEFSDILGTVAAKILGIPTVSTLHSLDEYQENKTANWRLKLRWFILRNFTDRIIAVSEKTRIHHINSGNLIENRIVTIYNGINLSQFNSKNQQVRETTRQQLNIQKEDKMIVTVAVLRELKGIQFMVKAMQEIISDYPNVHYVIVGDGEYKPTLIELVNSLNLGDQITFTGRRTDIPEILNACDLFVLPTLVDALPTVLIEALATKAPIVASNVGGIPEIIDDNVNGLLIPPSEPSKLANACVKLLSDEKLSKSLTQAGEITAKQRFDVYVQAKQLIDLYGEILVQHGK